MECIGTAKTVFLGLLIVHLSQINSIIFLSSFLVITQHQPSGEDKLSFFRGINRFSMISVGRIEGK